ncbi:trypsin-3-like [Maniola hyperantus]|uniref:trypsin-3-like n=1 Tax=Aphantopus hyperantus TaxID=2795564 RepID=UPI0037479F80
MLSTNSFSIIFVIVKLLVDWKFCEAGLRIIGGRNALKDEFPFAVRLECQIQITRNRTKQFEYRRFCTGAAISPSWILTSAHCDSDKLNFEPPRIQTAKKFARYSSYFPKEEGHLSPITKVIAHPSYIPHEYSKNVDNDIALYQTEKLKISSYGKISAIDYTSFIGHEIFVLGFGLNNASESEKPLQVLKGIVIKCNEGVSGLLCVVPQCGLEASTCSGDSGGSVVHASGIVGINSASFTTCERLKGRLLRPGLPSDIITMVSPFVDWISKIITNKTDESL